MNTEKPDELKLSHDGTTATVIARYGQKFVELTGPVSGMKATETEVDGVVTVNVQYEGFAVQRIWEEK